MYESEEMCYEYIPDEVTLKIHEIIKEEVNANLKSNLNELDRLRQSDKEQKNKIYELQREIKKIQEEYDKKLKADLLEKEKEVKRNIFHGFTVGDKVYCLDYKYEYIPCLTCKETGEIQVIINHKEEEIKCPHCGGNRRNSKYVPFIHQGVISQVDFKTWHDESAKCTESYFYIRTNKRDNDSQKKFDQIFKTEEEAIVARDLKQSKVN